MNTRTRLVAIITGSVLLTAGFLWGRFGAGVRPAPAAAPVTATATSPAQPSGRRILYYRNAMGLPDTSPVPKKDAMGMDYLPVYADEAAAPGQVRIDLDTLRRLGVRTEPVIRRPLTRVLRLAGSVRPDERLESVVSARFEGWITALAVNTTGAHVARGQELLEVYSPDLVTAQQDYRIAVHAIDSMKDGDADALAAAQKLVQVSLDRLRNWGIAESDLAELRQGAEPRRNLPLRAERGGVVTELAARVGMRFMPGDLLYRIADLSTVWLVGSVPEQDLAMLHVGQRITATAVAYPGRNFIGTVNFIAPVLESETRTAQVRIEVGNRDGLLKPAMFATIEISAVSPKPALTVPDSAILDTGTRQLVIVDRGDGSFEPRAIQAGIRGAGYREVRSGLNDGDVVVTDGNFLIDSESNLRSAIGSQRAAHSHEGSQP